MAEENDLVLAVGYMLRYNAAIEKAKKLLEEVCLAVLPRKHDDAFSQCLHLALECFCNKLTPHSFVKHLFWERT